MKIDREHIAFYIVARSCLKNILHTREVLPQPREGICKNLALLMEGLGQDSPNNVAHLLGSTFSSWELSTGSPIFPIAEYHWSRAHGLLWEGDQLAQRMSLIKHMIAEIDKALPGR